MKAKQLKTIIALMCAALCIFLMGCKKEKIDVNSPAEAEPEIIESLLPDVLPLNFTFSGESGAWSTYLTLRPDGSFYGVYHDSALDDTGEDYPQGTVYTCNFNGTFENMKKINDYTYSLTLGEIETLVEPGEEWIAEEIRYIAAEPYGLDGKEFLLYTPVAPVSELSEEFLSWWPNQSFEETPEIILFYSIYNKETEAGFFSVPE